MLTLTVELNGIILQQDESSCQDPNVAMIRARKGPPTITDIARRLGTSAMTVSRALTGKPEVSEEMRQKVTECAKMLGYQPNRFARSLVTQRSNMVGVVIPEIAHLFFADVISGIEEVLDEANYDILLCHSRGDPERERAEIRTLIGSHIDGLIVAPVQPLKSPELFLDLQNQQVPFVLFDRFFPGYDFPSVRLDDVAAGRSAAEFLVQLGHERIAHIAGPSVSPAKLRRQGFVSALRKAHVPISSDWIVRASFDMEGGRHATETLLSRALVPTAIFAANDPLALGAVYACREAGLRIPQDISVMGVGNIEGPCHPNPFLTTIDWPRQELGRKAASFLLDALSSQGKHPSSTFVFQPQVLARHSTASVAM
ncbi:MAG: LacI family DNA-binding transcriptional regulator [Bryobacteraceae bacterium]